MNPNFKTALDSGLVEPVIINGVHLEIEGEHYYQIAAHGTKMMMQRFNQYSDTMRKHETLRLSDSVLKLSLSSLMDIQNSLYKETADAFRAGSFDEDMFARWMEMHDAQKRLLLGLNERIDLGFDLYQSYEIAAIWFLTEDEDPAYTTTAKIRAKVEQMMSRPELYGFFLSLPLTNYNPLSLLFETDTLSLLYRNYLNESMELRALLLKSLPLGLKSETTSIIQLREGELRTSLDLIEQLSTITIDSFPQ